MSTLSLHDALPIWARRRRPRSSRIGHQAVGVDRRRRHQLRAERGRGGLPGRRARKPAAVRTRGDAEVRSEEHTSELQSRENLVCRLLLEKRNRSGSFMRTLNRVWLELPPRLSEGSPAGHFAPRALRGGPSAAGTAAFAAATAPPGFRPCA